MSKAICFVVVLIVESKKYYFERHNYFCDNLIHAKKFLLRSEAEQIRVQYEGALVETIKTGEVLK